MYILSQILVILSDVFCIISMFKKDKKNLLFYLIFSSTLFSVHYLCLGGWTGAVTGLIEITFLILMYVLEKYNKTKYNIYLILATMLITIIMSILTWNTWISILPMISMIIYLLTMIFKNVIIVKIGAFIRLALNALYMLLLGSYFGAGASIVILICTIVGIVLDVKSKKQQSDPFTDEK